MGKAKGLAGDSMGRPGGIEKYGREMHKNIEVSTILECKKAHHRNNTMV
jgi:hypothetical protein